MWRTRWGGAGGVSGSVISGKAGIFSSTARLPMPPSTFPRPPVAGPLQALWEHITRLSAPCHFLKISPTPFWFIFCSDVCYPHTHPPPKKQKKKTGVNWGAERPSRASCPSMMF